jgi:hypothetical protein
MNIANATDYEKTKNDRISHKQSRVRTEFQHVQSELLFNASWTKNAKGDNLKVLYSEKV